MLNSPDTAIPSFTPWRVTPCSLRSPAIAATAVAAAIAAMSAGCRSHGSARSRQAASLQRTASSRKTPSRNTALPANPARSRRQPAPATRAAVDSINGFISRGTPTFVVGTAGDDRADRDVAAQVALVHDALFPTARVVKDVDVDPKHWPPNPILYGGPQVNTLVRSLALPLSLSPGRLVIGGHTFAGDEFQLIAVVPAGHNHPELLLFAGTGTPGIAEINAHAGGRTSIVIKDAFGILTTGTWNSGTAVLGPFAPRPTWGSIARGMITVRSLRPLDHRRLEAVLHGLATARAKLHAPALPVTVYLYPDRATKKRVTGDAGDGNAVVNAHAIHAIAVAPSELQQLIAHEGTHVFAYQSWGPVGTPLLGEGLAVWASGGYGGTTLDGWAYLLRGQPPIAKLLARFRKLPERIAYPAAGLVVETAVAAVGLRRFRDHLYPATASQWSAACRAAGTTPTALQNAFNLRLSEARP